jgi:hypothetical protein
MRKLVALAAVLAMMLVVAAPAVASTDPTVVDTGSVMIQQSGDETMVFTDSAMIHTIGGDTMLHAGSVMIMTGGGEMMLDLDAPHHHMMAQGM